jgi:hypothetical protein
VDLYAFNSGGLLFSSNHVARSLTD